MDHRLVTIDSAKYQSHTAKTGSGTWTFSMSCIKLRAIYV